MEPSLFKNHEVYEQTISTIKKDLLRTKEDFIIEHNSKYTEPVMPPIWKTLEVTSFGTLSKLFCNIKDTVVKKQIARDFNLPQHVVLESWVKCAVAMRNYLAHHSRIWNRNFPIMPQFNSSFRGEWISNTAFPKVKLYSQLCCFQYMQKYVKTNWDFKLRLKSLLQQYPNVDIVAMGFPMDWENEPLWR
jgi:abortive infection bacteriophage resistance protein